MASLRDAADFFGRFARALPAEIREAEEASLADLVRTAEKRSGGKASKKTLRRADHPYAKRHGTPKLDPSIVNDQGGAFARSWEQEGPVERNGALESVAWNSADEAAFLDGTKTMVPRPIEERVLAEVEPRREARLDAALDRALDA